MAAHTRIIVDQEYSRHGDINQDGRGFVNPADARGPIVSLRLASGPFFVPPRSASVS